MMDVEVGDVLQFQDANLENIVSQINDKMNLWSLWPFVVFFGVLPLIYLGQLHVAENYLYAIAVLIGVGVCFAAYKDKVRKTVVIMYDLESTAADAYSMLCKSFDKLATSSTVWNVEAQGRVTDWKRNAGVSGTVRRSRIRLSYSPPPAVKTNISVPCIKGGKQIVYFFPDVILVTDGRKAGACAYRDIRVKWSGIRFVEGGSVPRDSKVVGQTWQYVNKTGGPDRRFKQNRQLPEVLYQEMSLEGPADLRKILQLSQYEDRSDFDAAMNGLVFAHEQALAIQTNAKFVTPGPDNTLLWEYPETPKLTWKLYAPTSKNQVRVSALCECGAILLYDDESADSVRIVCKQCGVDHGAYGDFKKQAAKVVDDFLHDNKIEAIGSTLRVTPATVVIASAPSPSESIPQLGVPPESQAAPNPTLRDRRDFFETLLGTWYGKSGLVLFSLGLAYLIGSQLPGSIKTREASVTPRETSLRTGTNSTSTPASSSTAPAATNQETAAVQNDLPLATNEVRELQSRLQGLGYTPGDIDGIAGPQTAEAVKRFEGARSLPVLGKIDRQTLNRLKDARAVP